MLQLDKAQPKRQALLAFAMLVLLVVLALLPGIHGSLYYDDFPLLGMAQKYWAGQASLGEYFSFGFNVGPLGRPISLLSFLLPWQDTETILATNIALHAANTLLVGLLVWRIGQMLQSPHALWLGVLTAALWGLAPIQAATVFIAIQRMASLSSFFVWLGLLLWVIGLQRSMTKSAQGYMLQITGLFGMTTLAALSKENGVLLPLLAGVIEATLFAHLALPGRSKRNLLYISTALLVFGYLAYSLWSSHGFFWERNFNAYERILTEPLVLFDYLRQTILPNLTEIHPFHDIYPVVRSIHEQPLAGIALIFWPAIALIAWYYRKRWPFASMAILWFLAAHILESSTLSLALYFEHRQYVAWFGPALAITWYAMNSIPQYRKIIITTLIMYILFLGFMLRQTAQIWGSPVIAAQIWLKDNMTSPRATEHMVVFYLNAGQYEKAFETHNSHLDKCPDCLNSLTLLTKLACVLGMEQQTQRLLQLYFERAPKTPTIGNSPETLSILEQSVQNSSCRLISNENLIHMNTVLLNRIQPMYDGQRQTLQLNLFQLTNKPGNLNSAASYLIEAFNIAPSPGFSLVVVRYLLAADLHNQARSFTEKQICSEKKKNFFQHHAWENSCIEATTMMSQTAQ